MLKKETPAISSETQQDLEKMMEDDMKRLEILGELGGSSRESTK